jgi:capsular polysaccharide biosynthesis protein
MDKNGNIIEINVKELIHTLVKKLWIIILCTIIFAAAAGFYSTNYLQPYYTSSAKLYILNRQAGDQTTMSDLQMGTTLTRDFMILITSRPVMDEVIRTLELNMSSDGLAGMISVYSPEDTRILEISVVNTDPDMAKLLADTIAKIASVSMVNIMGIDEVNIVEEGNYPYVPSGPNINRNIRLAGAIGAFLAAGIISAVYLLNDTIKSTEDIEKYLGLITLGSIPVREEKRYKRADRKHRAKRKKEIAA